MGLFKGSGSRDKKNWEKLYLAIRKQEWHKALQSLEELGKNDPENPRIHLKTGDLLRRTGDASGAVSAYHRAASGLIDSGFPHKAVAIYKIILRLSPEDRDALEKSREIVEEMRSPGPSVLEQTLSPPPGPPEAETTPDESADEEPHYFLDSTAHEEPPEEGPHAPPAGQEAPLEKQAEGGGRLTEIFSFLSEEEKEGLAGRSVHRRYKDGEAVVEEGDSGDSMYVIKSGKANVVSTIVGEPLLLASLLKGDFFGEVAFLTGRPRTASVIAAGDLDVMEIDRDLLQETIEKNPLFLDSLVDFYHSRAQDTIRKVKGGAGE